LQPQQTTSSIERGLKPLATPGATIEAAKSLGEEFRGGDDMKGKNKNHGNSKQQGEDNISTSGLKDSHDYCCDDDETGLLEDEKVTAKWVGEVVDDVKWKDRDLEAAYEEALYEAAKVGDEDDVKALIKKGAKVNFPNGVQNMESALHIACVNGNLNAAMALLDHNGDLNQKDADGLTPLEASTAAGREEMTMAIGLFLANLL